jgi:2,3-bisphosphoglycerate-dependent phosphoglycerate mutase
MEQNLDPKKTCTIYLVRHGETDWNVQKKMQGNQNIPLNKNGEKQAREASKRLKKIKFDAAYSSDLIRAKRTTEIIALEHKLVVKTNQALRERNFGEFEGQTTAYLRAELKDILDKLSKLPYKVKANYQFPRGIESINSSVSRFITFLREIAIAHPDQTILVGTHGGMIRHLLIHLGFGPEEELDYGAVSNTAHVKILTDGLDFFVTDTWGVNKNES